MRSLLLASILLGGTSWSTAAPAPREQAITRALDYLKKTQSAADGTWKASRYNANPAVTSLAVMAFLSAGHQPGKGPYGETIERGIRAVLKAQHPNGLIASNRTHEMYHHGIATLMLAQAIDQSDGKLRAELRKALDRAVAVILKAQRTVGVGRGGWRYQVVRVGDSDMSVTGWQVPSLVAARRVGCTVPQERIDQAVAFVRRCYDARSGGFAYRPFAHLTCICTQSGMLALVLCGKDGRGEPEVLRGAAYLRKNPLRWNMPYFSDALYHGAQLTAVMGTDRTEPLSKELGEALDKLLADVLKRQKEDGSWPTAGFDSVVGPHYTTAMAVLALTAQDRRLVPFREEKPRPKGAR